MIRLLLLAVVIVLLPRGPAGLVAADDEPLPDFRVTDTAGRYYVVWKRTGGPKYFGVFGPMEFSLAERAAGTPPVEPARAMIIANLDLYDQERGSRYYKMFDAAEVCVRPGDRLLGRGIFPTPPRVVLVSSTGLGFVALDSYGANFSQVVEGRGGQAVVVVSRKGRVRHALKLADLFTPDQVDRFPAYGNTVSWLRGGWINESPEELVVLGVGGRLRVLHLVSGEVRDGSGEDVVRGLESTDPETLKQALVLAADGKLADAAEPARVILTEERFPPEVRLRAAVLLAVLDPYQPGLPQNGQKWNAPYGSGWSGLGGAPERLIRQTAATRSAEDPTAAEQERPLLRAVAVEYLPEVCGAEALPILIDALRNGRAERGAAFQALIKLGQRSVPAVLALAEPGEDRRLRLAAVGILGGMGPAARGAVGKLVELLDDDDLLVCIKAAFALADVDPTQTAILPVLREGLHFTDPNLPSRPIRIAAAHWLAQRGPQGTAILAEALKDADAAIRRLAAATFGQADVAAEAAAPALVEALGDEDAEVRHLALEALLQPGPKAVPAALAGLEDRHSEVRSGSAYVLGRTGFSAPEAAWHLREALADEVPRVRCTAAAALAHHQADPILAVNALVELLEDPDPYIRAKAAYSLGEFGSRAEAAADRLIEALSDTDQVARQAAAALGEIGDARAAVVESLRAALGHPNRLVRRAAAESLGLLGPQARAAVPRLVELLDDPDWHVPHIAATSLGQIGIGGKIPTEEVPVLTGLLGIVADSGRETELRMAAIDTLGRLGRGAEVVVPVLLEALADPCPAVARQAVVSLAAFGAEAVDGLIQSLDNPCGYTRCYAADALGRIGPEAVSSVPKLIEAFADADAATGYYTVAPIIAIGAGAVPHLQQALTHENRQIRAAAAETLGRFGARAEPAMAALVAAQSDPDDYVRRHAGWALAKIGKSNTP